MKPFFPPVAYVLVFFSCLFVSCFVFLRRITPFFFFTPLLSPFMSYSNLPSSRPFPLAFLALSVPIALLLSSIPPSPPPRLISSLCLLSPLSLYSPCVFLVCVTPAPNFSLSVSLYLSLPCCRPWSAVSAASGWGPGSGVPGPEAAAAAGDGAAQCLPEQDQDADRGTAWAWAAEAGAEGVTAPSTPGTKGVVK